MTIFRIPLNVLVVVGTRLEAMAPLAAIFTTCALWFGAACLLQCGLAGWAKGHEEGLAAAKAAMDPPPRKAAPAKKAD